jgi:N-acetylmuramoyl-L-alanine amidase
MKILLDPGHGGRDPGAIGVELSIPTYSRGSKNGAVIRERIKEKDITLAVAQRAAGKLRALGYTVLLTRDEDVAVSLHERTDMALAEHVDAFISIHANAGGGTGCEVWYQDGDETSRDLAAALEEGVRGQNLVPSRGLKAGNATTRTNWYTFTHLRHDALVELAFLDCESDATQLQQNPERFAQGIVDGVLARLPLGAALHDHCNVERQQLIAQRDAMLAQVHSELMSDRTDLAYAIRLANGASAPTDLGGMTRAERLRELNEKWAGKI